MSYSGFVKIFATILVLFAVVVGGYLFLENSKLNKEVNNKISINSENTIPQDSKLLLDTEDKNTKKPTEIEPNTTVAQKMPPKSEKSKSEPEPQPKPRTQPTPQPNEEIQSQTPIDSNTQIVDNTPAEGSVTISTPNGGESYKTLETILIKWNSTVSGFDKNRAYIYFNKLKGDSWSTSNPTSYIANTGSLDVTTGVGVANTGELNWTIPKFASPGKYVAYLMVSFWSNPNPTHVISGGTKSDWSDIPFTISTDDNTAAAIPTITKLDPYTAHSGSEVTVTGTGFTANSDVNLRSSNNGVSLATTTTLSNRTLKFTVPTFLSAGTYSVTVINSNGESQGKDITISR